MKIEVQLSAKSQEHIDFLIKAYKEVYECPKQINGRTLIHIYPKSDTINDNDGHSSGFYDAINCEVHIYNTDNMTVFKTKHHDQIELEVPCRTRIFKDLSTMLLIDCPVTFGNCQSLEERKVR